MHSTLLLLCGVALLTGKCQSDVVIQPCPNGQRNVSEYNNVSIACGQCGDSIDWYIDYNNAKRQYIGGCTREACSFQSDSSFRLKVTPTEGGKLDGLLDMVRVTRNDAGVVSCKCYRYIFYYNSSADNGYYLEGSDSCQIFVEESLTEQKQEPSEISNNWWRWAVIGGVAAFAVIIVIIVTVIAVYRFKRLKDTQVKGKTNLSFQPCPEDLYDQKKSLSQSYATVNNFKSEPTIKREAAFKGDLYTVPMAMTSSYPYDERRKDNNIAENTMFKRDEDSNHQANRVVSKPTASRTAMQPTAKPKQTTATRTEFGNISGTAYTNNAEVTDTDSDVYQNAPWGRMPAHTKPFSRDSYAAALSLDDGGYVQINDDYLQFNDDNPRQNGRAATFYRNECFI